MICLKAEPISLSEIAPFFSLFLESTGLLLAVSGGPDSLALLSLVHQWHETQMAAPPFQVATVDHGLRPESGDEAAHVAALCQKLSIPHHVLLWEGSKPCHGIPEAARHARYTLLTQCAQSQGLSHIVTAHTADDQAETLLMRLGRSTGISGLAGIRKIRPLTENILLSRPLLTFSKERLQATIENVGLKPAHDPSNHDVRFMRAKIRSVRPHLETIALTTPSLLSLARRAARADDALKRIAEEKFKTLISKEENSRLVFKKAIFDEPEEILVRLLERTCQQTTFSSQPSIRLEQLESLSADLCAAQKEGRAFKKNVGKVFFQLKKCGQLIAKAENPRRFSHLYSILQRG